MSSSHTILDQLKHALDRESTSRFVLAYSGGIDSHVLLHAMVNYLHGDERRLHAVHIDHGLHNESSKWARICGSTARKLGVTVTTLKLGKRPPAGESIESWARRHRYRLLQTTMMSGDVLLTAHHRDDLAETALLQLFRGAGPHGLACIPVRRTFGPGLLVRPLLAITRTDVAEYASAHRLEWINDPSNATDRYDRNFIRHHVLTAIEARWPAVSARIAHAVTLQQQAAASLDAAADAILKSAISSDGKRLPLAVLYDVDEEMQRWVLRRWFRRADFPIPDAVHLREMQRLFSARQDAQPCVSWKRAELRRYRDQLYLRWARVTPDCAIEYRWQLRRPLALPGGVLSAEISVRGGLNSALVGQREIIVRFRRGGERCHPLDRTHSQSLKRLFQEWAVPSWQRSEIPLVYVGGQLAAVAGYCVCRPFAGRAGEASWKLQWCPDDIQYQTPDH